MTDQPRNVGAVPGSSASKLTGPVATPSQPVTNPFDPKTKKTDSMVVAGRSGIIPDAGAAVPEGDTGNAVVMAGPMPDFDPLYIVMFVISVSITAIVGVGIFLPNWFRYHSMVDDNNKYYTLFDSTNCDTAENSIDPHNMYICYGRPERLGYWVPVVQILSSTGLGLSVINLFMQSLNLCIRPRRYKVHMLTMYIMALAGLVLLLAGHLAHHFAVWRDAVYRHYTGSLIVEPVGSGLFLLSCSLCGWCCVLIHVTSHAPGPVSVHTRFLHTLESYLVPVTPVHAPPPPPIVSMEEVVVELPDERKASIRSTAV